MIVNARLDVSSVLVGVDVGIGVGVGMGAGVGVGVRVGVRVGVGMGVLVGVAVAVGVGVAVAVGSGVAVGVGVGTGDGVAVGVGCCPVQATAKASAAKLEIRKSLEVIAPQDSIRWQVIHQCSHWWSCGENTQNFFGSLAVAEQGSSIVITG